MTDASLSVSFRDCNSSDTLERQVRADFVSLLELGVEIYRAHVTLAIPHKSHSRGNQCAVHITLQLAGRTIAVGSEHRPDRRGESMSTSISDAFARARRQLIQHKERIRTPWRATISPGVKVPA